MIRKPSVSPLSTLFAQRTEALHSAAKGRETLRSAAKGRETLHSVYLSFLYQFTVTIHGFIGEHCFCWLPMKV